MNKGKSVIGCPATAYLLEISRMRLTRSLFASRGSLLVLACIGCFGARAGEDSAVPDADLKARAIEAVNAGRWPEALELADRGLHVAPGDPELRRARAFSLVSTGRADESALIFGRLVADAPDSAIDRQGLCWVLILGAKPLDARPHCERAVFLDSSNYANTVNLGHTYLLASDPETARIWYRRAVSLISEEQELVGGPLADFELFIRRGWHVEEARSMSTSMAERTRKWLAYSHELIVEIQRYAEMQEMREVTDARASVAQFEMARERVTALVGDDNIWCAAFDLIIARLYALDGRLEDGYARALRGRQTANVAALGGPTRFDVFMDQAEISALTDMGRFDEALPIAVRNVKRADRQRDRNPVTAMSSMGLLAYLDWSLGANDDALKLITEIEERVRALYGPHDDRTIAVVIARCNGLMKVGRFDEARASAEDSFANLAVDSPETGKILGVLASLSFEQGRLTDAIAYESKALSFKETNPQLGESPFWNVKELITLYIAAGRAGEADRLVERLERFVATERSPLVRAKTFATLSNYYWAIGERDSAIYFGKLAVNELQALRASTERLSPELQKGFVAGNRQIYEQLADRLISMSRLSEAEAVLALLKDYEYEQITRGDATPARKAAVPMTAAETRMSFDWGALVAEGAELADLNRQNDRPAGELDANQRVRLQLLRDRQVAWDTSLARFLQALQPTLSSDARRATELRADIELETSAFSRWIGESNRLSGATHLGLSYIATEDAVSIIVTTGEGSFPRRVEIKRKELNQRIVNLRKALTNRDIDPRPDAAALYTVLVAPIEEALRSFGPTVVVLNLSNELRYIPFAALFDGKRYLVERYAFALYASHGFAGVRMQTPGRWSAAGLGTTIDAQVDDMHYRSLPKVREEVEAVVRTAGTPHGAFPGTIALDSAFTRVQFEDTLADARRGHAQLVHVASHFHLAPSNDAGSYLILGDGAPLRLSNIKNLSFTGISLLTLSACDTATPGRTNTNGSEVEGLASIAQVKGAEATLGTLWQINDAGSEAFMKSFYTLLREGRDTTALTIQRAQLSLLKGAETQSGISRRSNAPAPRFAHPYYWAPFILMGNWL